MTFVGKVLVVVQLFLSIVFMAFAGAVYTFQSKWKEKYEAAESELQTMTAERDELVARARTRTESARATLAGNGIDVDPQADLVEEMINAFKRTVADNGTLSARLQVAQDELTTQRTTHEDMVSSVAVHSLQSDLANEASKARLVESDQLRMLNLTAQGDLQAKEATLRKIEDESFELARAFEEAQRRYDTAIVENSRLRRLLLLNEIDPDSQPATRDAPPPPVEGLVLDTDSRNGSELVEISIGGDDGLKEGDSLFVYREQDGKYLGRIELVFITPDRSVGSVVERAKNGSIVRGDNVATKL